MSKPGKHRGAAPEDVELYDPRHRAVLRTAMEDLHWLLDRGYAMASTAELVGNRHELTARQRAALIRCAASTSQVRHRRSRELIPEDMRGRDLWLDGFNVLTTVEVAMAGGVMLRGCDGCYRDVAGVHARYRKVAETLPALQLIGEILTRWGVRECRWYLDSPVSNSGRLKTMLTEMAARHGWNWNVELVFNPDKVLAQSAEIIATADSAILDRCTRWVNLAGHVVSRCIPSARIVDLAPGE